MSHIFAIDWDRREVRALFLQSGPTGTSIAGAWAAPLAPTEGAAPSGKEVGAQLAKVMASEADAKATTIVGVGRDHVQIKLLSLPPAPDDELPELVRFQAERDFTTLGSEAALDYIPLTGDAQTPHQVLAVSLSPAGLNDARDVCQAVGLETDRVTVRACATASLVHRSGSVDADAVALVVNPLGDEADLTVIDGEKVVLMRTVRLPDAAQGPGRQRTLVGEIRRTVAAARQQSEEDRPIEQILLCGNASSIDRIDGLADELGMPVLSFDPAAYAPSGLTMWGVSAESLGRFSAVLGMAFSEADRRRPIVDFLNVRRKEEKRRFTRTHALAAAAAGLAILAVGFLLWRQHYVMASELAQVRAELEERKPLLVRYAEPTELWQAINDWKATDVNWLEVLEVLGQRMRPKPLPKGNREEAWKQLEEQGFDEDNDIVVQQITMTRSTGLGAQGGRIELSKAAAKSNNAVNALANRLREDGRLRVEPPRGGEDTGNTVPGYRWLFDMRIHVPPAEEFTERAAGEEENQQPQDEQPQNEAVDTESTP